MSNRTRGDYFERQAKDALVGDGWIVVRSAGSFGIADLVALRAGRAPLLISCKLGGRIGREERRQLIEACVRADAMPIVAMRKRRGHVLFCTVRGDTLALSPFRELRDGPPGDPP